MRIQGKLLGLIAPPLLGLVVIAIYAVEQSRRTMTEHEMQSAASASRMLAYDIERAVAGPIEEWRAISRSSAVQDALRAANERAAEPGYGKRVREIDLRWKDDGPSDALRAELFESSLAHDLAAHVESRLTENGLARYGEVIVTNAYGASIAQSGMTSDYYQADETWWTRAVRDGFYVGDPKVDESAGVYSVDLVTRIDDDAGQLAGVVKVVLSLGSIIEIIHDRKNVLGNEAVVSIALLDADGSLIFATDPPGLPPKSLHFAWWLDDNTSRSSGDDSEDATKRGGMFGFARTAGDHSQTRWSTLVLWDEQIAFAGIRALQTEILIIAAGLAVLASGVAVFLAQSMTRRIRRLAKHAEAHSRGERGSVGVETSTDEIGDLSRSFAGMANAVDLSERRLRDERAVLEAVLSAIPFQVYWRSADLVFTGCNRAFAQWIGVGEPDDLIGEDIGRLVHLTGDLEALFAEDAQILEEDVTKIHEECEIELADGSHATLHVSKLPLRYSDGSIYGVLCGFIDMTDRKALEDRLYQSMKLESIGQLAAGIAHEINTPAQYVGDNTRFLQQEFAGLTRAIETYRSLLDTASEPKTWQERSDEMRAILDELDIDFLMEEIPNAIAHSIEGIDRVAHIVSAMKDFSHPGSASTELTDLNSAIQATVTICSNRWKYVADLDLALDPDLPQVKCMRGEFNQVVLNLIVNAADAIEERFAGKAEKGRIEISTRLEGGEAVIEIADNGGGIPPSARAKIFDPFFTTKAVGKGTGQGLSISRDVIVNKHGGSLDFEVEPDHGTTFVIRLPLRAADPDADTIAA